MFKNYFCGKKKSFLPCKMRGLFSIYGETNSRVLFVRGKFCHCIHMVLPNQVTCFEYFDPCLVDFMWDSRGNRKCEMPSALLKQMPFLSYWQFRLKSNQVNMITSYFEHLYLFGRNKNTSLHCSLLGVSIQRACLPQLF